MMSGSGADVPLPLEGRVAVQRPGGVIAAELSVLFASSMAEATPSGASRHLPLKGGEEVAP
jgi:hypothetical protein